MPTSRGPRSASATPRCRFPHRFDYDLWCGPADNGPIYRDQFSTTGFTWDKGDGESANQGVHEIDVARWLLNEPEMPRRTISIGGRFVFNDAGDVPNTQIIYYDFPRRPSFTRS